MKRALAILGGVFLLLLIAGGVAAVLVVRAGGVGNVVGGETRLLDYLGAQVVGIANTHLVPDLGFETIRYDPPYTVSMAGVTLTAQDSTRVLDLGRMTVTLAERPRIGQPIKIARLELANGAINLIRDPATGGLRGLSPIVEPRPEREQRTAEEPEFRLSEVLVLEKIVISGIDLVYDESEGAEPMRLDALAADLDIIPAADAGPGWYVLRLASGREPGLELDLDGRLNIDSFDLDINRLTAGVLLDEGTAKTLPPRLASMLAQYQVRGRVAAEVTGRIPLMAPAGAELSVQGSLDDGRAVFGEYQIPLDSVTLAADMASGIVELRNLEVDSMGGTLTAEGRLGLDDEATVSWTLAGMNLRELLASRPTDQPPKMAGTVASTGSARTRVDEPIDGLRGTGEISVTQGRLVNIPVFSDLVRVAEIARLGSASEPRDSFQTPFTLTADGIRLDGFDFRTPALAARGTGMIGFDGSLDISANGGPLESVQNKLGPLGGILGKITDQFVTYRIRGTTADPKVAVQPLGIGG